MQKGLPNCRPLTAYIISVHQSGNDASLIRAPMFRPPGTKVVRPTQLNVTCTAESRGAYHLALAGFVALKSIERRSIAETTTDSSESTRDRISLGHRFRIWHIPIELLVGRNDLQRCPRLDEVQFRRMAVRLALIIYSVLLVTNVTVNPCGTWVIRAYFDCGWNFGERHERSKWCSDFGRPEPSVGS